MDINLRVYRDSRMTNWDLSERAVRTSDSLCSSSVEGVRPMPVRMYVHLRASSQCPSTRTVARLIADAQIPVCGGEHGF